ncbi:MucR family transcriptional regulator [Methylobacterium komagatae]
MTGDGHDRELRCRGADRDPSHHRDRLRLRRQQPGTGIGHAGLIRGVHASLVGLAAPVPAEPAPELPTAAELRKSVRPDALTSFHDGRPYKTLKRHPAVNGMAPERYRARFGLPADYPMTTPSYSTRRSELAKQRGLGVQHR